MLTGELFGDVGRPYEKHPRYRNSERSDSEGDDISLDGGRDRRSSSSVSSKRSRQ